jgi:HEAT repeat protein
VRRDTPTAACRLALYALVRLKAYRSSRRGARRDGQPRVRWWPVAFALQRLEDKRALPALLTLAKERNPYTRAFAVKGWRAEGSIGAAGADAAAVERRARVLIETFARSAGSAIRRRRSAAADHRATRADPHVRSKRSARSARSTRRTSATRCSTCWPIRARRSRARRCDRWRASIRRTSSRAVRARSRPHWSVRAALATVLGTLPPENGLPRLDAMLDDADQRVVRSRSRAREAEGAQRARDLLER